MGGRWWRTWAATVATLVLLLLPTGPGQAGPAAAPAGPTARPTVDHTAPTPTAPRTGLPPRGSAPDGSTVGGDRLRTRGVVVAAGAPPVPAGIAASAWLVADAGTGAVLGARDPHGRHYPASTLKTLTFLTLAHRLDPDDVVVGTVADERMEGSRVGLVAGGRYPVSLLFTALMLQSGNDAASALARAAGGEAATLAAMNRTARQLGAFDTVAGAPSGLDVAGQSSSAYDLALFFRALVEDPTTAAVLRAPTADMPPVEGRSPGYQIQNQNPLLGSYPGNLGGKTGFTDAARHTFVTAAEREGRRLVVSVLGTENLPLRAADQAALLLDWGFTVPAGSAGVGRLVRPGDLGASPAAAPRGTPATPTSDAAPPPSRAPAAAPVAQDPPSGTAAALTVGAGMALALGLVVAVSLRAAGRRRARRSPQAPLPGRRPPPQRSWPSRPR